MARFAMTDETGNRYGMLTIFSRTGVDAQGRVMWACKCDCGNTAVVRGTSLRRGSTRSCGCLRRHKKMYRSSILGKD